MDDNFLVHIFDLQLFDLLFVLMRFTDDNRFLLSDSFGGLLVHNDSLPKNNRLVVMVYHHILHFHYLVLFRLISVLKFRFQLIKLPLKHQSLPFKVLGYLL